MPNLPLSFACLDYDRTRALQDGRVRVEGVDLNFMALPVEETFYRQLRHHEFDVSEMSLSSYVLTLNDENPPFVGIPIFPSRYFRHQSMYINVGSGINSPSDLRGKRIGIPEYQMTASVWQRGILRDDYDVPTASMQYFTGGLEEPGRKEKLRLSLPTEISVTPIGPEQTLSSMLAAGEIDAIFSASEPSCLSTSDQVRHLFPNYREVEQAYYERTRIFPIMHIVALRRELHERAPWVAPSLTKAFYASLEISYADLRYRSALKTMLPWLADHVRDTEAVMGRDFWQYGLEPNRHVLERFLAYSYDQGLAKTRWTPDDLFFSGASDIYKL